MAVVRTDITKLNYQWETVSSIQGQGGILLLKLRGFSRVCLGTAVSNDNESKEKLQKLNVGRIINDPSNQDVKSAEVMSKVKNKGVIEGSYKNLPELQGQLQK